MPKVSGATGLGDKIRESELRADASSLHFIHYDLELQ
jgi:hypothetical protein